MVRNDSILDHSLDDDLTRCRRWHLGQSEPNNHRLYCSLYASRYYHTVLVLTAVSQCTMYSCIVFETLTGGAGGDQFPPLGFL